MIAPPKYATITPNPIARRNASERRATRQVERGNALPRSRRGALITTPLIIIAPKYARQRPATNDYGLQCRLTRVGRVPAKSGSRRPARQRPERRLAPPPGLRVVGAEAEHLHRVRWRLRARSWRARARPPAQAAPLFLG